MRIALYSHDTMGVGHMRRNLLIAQSLTRAIPSSTVLMIAGAKEANAFAVPKGVDCLTLPALRKDLSGCYQSGSMRLPLPELIVLRSAAIRAAIEAFDPHVLIVDKVPRGVEDELIPTLDSLGSRGTTRCVLGLREVLDEQSAAIESWKAARTTDVIRDYFDAVWVYGDPSVFDLVREYQLPGELAEKVRFTGYLDQRQRTALDGEPPGWLDDLPESPFVLCVVGGGQDGARLAHVFVDAASRSGKPAVLLTGPCMPAESRLALKRHARRCANLRILDFVPEADWLVSRAERVVSMGGYNTVCSVLSFGKPAMIVPRIHPRREQLVRARRLEALGFVEVLHPHDLDAQRLARWMACRRPQWCQGGTPLNFDGLARIAELISELAPAARPVTLFREEHAHVVT